MTGTILEALRWFVTALLMWTMALIVPVAPFLIFTTCLVLCDLYTGTRAAIHRKEVLHSKGFRRSIEKIVLYFLAILLSAGMEYSLCRCGFNRSNGIQV
jgi:hypothetical protein